ncbi:TonB family protein [Rudaea sp.]|uniref:M56 family metallopeptidase n=1 Tax=Rudaea sp. TaxID=2136325 RepID=UPI002ED69554
MNALTTELVPYVHALGWSLLHFLWQGALIGLAYALLRGSCRTSVARHRLGMLCLMAMLACPLVTLALLWPTPVDPADLSTAMSSVSTASVSASAEVTPAGLEAWLPWCVGLWLAGVCMIALRSFLHWRHLAALVRSATALPRDWQLRLIELRQRFGILRPVRLLASFAVATPTLVGWLKPTILLPASLLSGFTPAQIELILAHELAHVRRYDYIANLIQVVVETLLFYHPVVHWICADVRQQREQCCDDLVLGVGGGERLAYARTLADLEEWTQGESGFGAAMPALGAGGGVLLERVRRIVDPRPARSPGLLSRDNGMTLPALLAGAGLLLALLRLHAPSADALGAALVRASATSAELLAVATLRIHADTPILASRIRPTTLVVPPPREADRPPVAVAPPASKVAERTEAPAAIVTPHIAATDPSAVSLPSSPAAVQAQAAAVPVPSVVAEKTPAAVIAPSGPQALRVVQPSYPLDALRNGVAGKVDLEFRVDGEGRVRDIHVLSAQPAGVFEQSAIAALRQWRFEVPSTSARFTRSFAFTRGASATENCREITGSHICRKPNPDGESN